MIAVTRDFLGWLGTSHLTEAVKQSTAECSMQLLIAAPHDGLTRGEYQLLIDMIDIRDSPMAK